MALVMPTTMVPEYVDAKLIVTSGTTQVIAEGGITHLEVVTFPPQGDFPDGAVLGLIQKPFIDFAASCGGAGAMTAASITAHYGNVIPDNLVEAIVADFAKAYGNYVVIPAGVTLMITGTPIASVFDLTIPDPPVEDPII